MGATKWENRGSKTFCAPPPPYEDRVNIFAPPPPILKGGNSIWLKLQASATKTLPSPLFVVVNLHSPPLPFCSLPPPLPVISDHSLMFTLLSSFRDITSTKLGKFCGLPLISGSKHEEISCTTYYTKPNVTKSSPILYILYF